MFSPDQSTEADTSEKHPADLIASTDGVITNLITRTGVPQVHIGDIVTKGTLLVSGQIALLNDSGEVTGYRYEHADADIFADTQLTYLDELPYLHKEKLYTGKKSYFPFLRIGSFQLETRNLNSSDSSVEEARISHQFRLGENFSLPFYYGYEMRKKYQFEEKKYVKKEVQQILSHHFHSFCKDLEEKGIQIREKNVKIYMYTQKASASGTLYLNQRIEKERDTEINTMERKEPNEPVGTDN